MNELNPYTLEYIIADLKNKLVSYRKTSGLSLSEPQRRERLGQIKLLELLIANYKDNLSELLIDIENEK